MQIDGRPPCQSDWAAEWPDWTRLTPKQRRRFKLLIADRKRIGARAWQRPRGIALEVWKDPRQWEDVYIQLEGKLARPGEVVRVTRWVWEHILRRYPDIRLLKHGRRGKRGKGSPIYYAFPSSRALAKRLRESGRTSNPLTLAGLLNAASGIGDWDSRSDWHSTNRFDCTVFNLTVKHLPKTPDGEDAKRSRLVFVLGLEEPDGDA